MTPLGNLFEAVNGQKYYGRGHIHLRWNGKYGQFSKAFHDDLYNGKDFLLEEPARILEDPLMMYTSALWLYMTPHFPKPSAHDVITGKFRPNRTDLTYGAGNDFGTTIHIMAQDSQEGLTSECYPDNGIETEAAAKRAEFYQKFLEHFQMPSEDKTGCVETLLTYSGSGQVGSFWEYDPENNDSCHLVQYETEFSVYNKEDYKRCVCHFFSDNGEESCP